MHDPLDMAPFAERRDVFASTLGDGVAVIPGARQSTGHSGRFRQDSDFYYLTGFDEPDAVAVINPSHDKERYVLFVRPSDRFAEMWDGRRAGVDGAIGDFGADAAYPVSDLDRKLREYLIGSRTLHYRLGNRDYDDKILNFLRHAPAVRTHGRTVVESITDPRLVLHEMRLRKTMSEIGRLRTACEITAAGHVEAMLVAAPGMHEYEVQAAIEHTFRRLGSARDSYESIVAAGANACILHYTSNNALIGEDDLLLVDAGAEYGYLAGDITRTFPASGTFSGPQKELYEIVLAANEAAIALARPGLPFREIHETARRVITEGLVALGVLPRGVEDSLSMWHDREFFPHGTGHWLGMDVHDVGAAKVDRVSRPLEPGMAFTIEPGIYFDPARESVEFALLPIDEEALWERRLRLGQGAKAEEDAEREGAEKVRHPVPERFRGIGIRIEDDILVTESGCEVLTGGVPKSVAEVEAMCREGAG
ncbi:MAG TPA: aminopeptidase P N-terminal domain-containing protein [Actinomycetota bacterium]|nr:aminopeptidase P N-terminal domain-containing protein [Actinomycetota bacterium]